MRVVRHSCAMLSGTDAALRIPAGIKISVRPLESTKAKSTTCGSPTSSRRRPAIAPIRAGSPLTDDDGFGLKAIGMPLLSFSAWPFRMSELEHEKTPVNIGHKHSSEIVNSDDITVNLDYRQMGVGGDDSWGAPIHKEFSLPAVAYEYKFRLEPIASVFQHPECHTSATGTS